MKLISLNIWGGQAGKTLLLDFFKKYKKDVDVFCLQEVYAAYYDYSQEKTANRELDKVTIVFDGLQSIEQELGNNFTALYHPHFYDLFGLMLALNKKHSINESGDVFVHKERGHIPKDDNANHARNIQYVSTIYNEKKINILNFHGLWNGKGKTDSDDRLDQSRKIIEFINSLEGEVVLAGDFNLRPDTESIRILEEAGLRNLVTEYNITDTRTSFYKKEERYADYMFVSNGIDVKDFKVLPDEVSDHAPLYLDFE